MVILLFKLKGRIFYHTVYYDFNKIDSLKRTVKNNFFLKFIHILKMKTILLFILTIWSVVGTNICDNYEIKQQGSCNQTFLAFVEKTAKVGCIATINNINQFEDVLQSAMIGYGFSSFVTFNQTSLGFYLCLGDPCYLTASVGEIGLFGVFIGRSCSLGERQRSIFSFSD